MKQIVLTAPYTLEERGVPIPEINDRQVLLKIKQFGICASDIQMYRGKHKYMAYPVVIGHEVAATIAKVGKNVSGLQEGDNVTVEPQITCGVCYACRNGHMNVCEHLKVMGVHADGFACEYSAVDSAYIHLCKGLSVDQTTMIEPIAVAIGSVKCAGNLNEKNVVVIGAGTIGNLVAQCAMVYGAKNVMITDIKQKKLDLAHKCGIKYPVNTNDITLKNAILEMFGSQKADVIIDCAATNRSILSALDAARTCSTIIITGNFKYPVEIELTVIQRQEIKIIGHMMYVPEDFKEAIRLVREGRINTEILATHHYDIDSLGYAFSIVDDDTNDVMKCLISLT